jgi:predicted naringenin-chalcone synthase
MIQPCALRGIGTALPSHRFTQDEAVEGARALFAGAKEYACLKALFRRAGVRTRHMALSADAMRQNLAEAAERLAVQDGPAGGPGPTTGQRMEDYAALAVPLALEAGRQALDRSDTPPRQITHLVTASCTGFTAPGVDVALVKGLGLPLTVQRTHVGYMGCHGGLNGLRLAASFTAHQPRARVLLCAVELCSLHYHYGNDPQKVVANALFADGAAALVGVPAEAAPADAWRVAASGACLFPDSEDAMAWRIGDNGFEMGLSPRVPALIGQGLRPWITHWLDQQGLTLADVATWAVHPGGPMVLRAVEECLGLRKEQIAVSWEVLAECGNMSSATVFFILDRLGQRQAARPCVALGFGPGLAAEAALFL